MEERTFKFSVDKYEINIPLQSPEEDMILFEQLNPWADKRTAALIPAKQFITDMNTLIPDHIEEDLDKTMYPCLLETLATHAKVYGHLADADYCTYLNYYYLIRHHLALATGVETISEADQKGAMLGFHEWLQKQDFPLEQTDLKSL
jgi:hypothetical protein